MRCDIEFNKQTGTSYSSKCDLKRLQEKGLLPLSVPISLTKPHIPFPTPTNKEKK